MTLPAVPDPRRAAPAGGPGLPPGPIPPVPHPPARAGWAPAGPVLVPALAGGALLVLVAGTVLAGDAVRTALATTGSLALPVGAALSCAAAARRSGTRSRRGWTALACAATSWAAGRAGYTALESLGDGTVPFPSVADIGYLGFPVAALAGLALLTPTGPGLATPRRLIDALMVGCALALLTWVTAIEPEAAAGLSAAPIAVSLSYAVSDIVLFTVALLTLAQTREKPLLWGLLAGAMLAMGISDAVFSAGALSEGTADDYVTGSVVDWGWWTAFALLATAGALVGRRSRPGDRPVPAPAVASARLLPYLPLAAAVVVVAVAATDSTGIDRVTVVLVVALVGLVLARQYATVRENQTLARTLQERERELAHLAFHDPLTGLANRSLFLDRLGNALDRAERDGRPVAVVFCDLDGFKAVNDALGHSLGDALLVRVAERLGGALRSGDTLARLGGDEFAVLLEGGGGEAGGTATARRLLAALREPIRLGGRTVTVSASIGVAAAGPGTAAGTLLHRADVAMYAVKAAGKSGVLVHGRAMDTSARRDVRSLHDPLAAALRAGAIQAVYQPVVDPATGRVGALEALARWTHDGAEVSPTVFVPLAERAGLSGHLTALMLERAAHQLALWNAGLGHRRLRVAVNISPVELSDTGLPGRIAHLVARHRLAHGQLIVEITETTVSNRPDAATDIVAAVRAAGVRVALDDFGTGFSSLARLSGTPVDTVKIDRFFVADIDHDVHQKRFLVGLLELTRHIGVRTVAEGVERPGQLRELQRLGCDLVQGHLIARPAPAAAFTPMILADAPFLPPSLLPLSAGSGLEP